MVNLFILCPITCSNSLFDIGTILDQTSCDYMHALVVTGRFMHWLAIHGYRKTQKLIIATELMYGVIDNLQHGEQYTILT